MHIITDTSVILAVITNEATKPILIAKTTGATLVSPRSVHWEIGNALSAMLKRNRITFTQAQQALQVYATIPIRFVDTDMDQALQLVNQLNIYAYDAYIIASAVTQAYPLLTLDSGLRHAAQLVGVTVVEITP